MTKYWPIKQNIRNKSVETDARQQEFNKPQPPTFQGPKIQVKPKMKLANWTKLAQRKNT